MSHKKEKVVAPTVVTTPQHTTDTVSGNVPVYAHGQTPVVAMATQHLADGRLPPNELIHTELNQTAEYLAERERLNPNKDQSQVLKDVRELVEVANVTLAEKNRGDIAQKFMSDVNLVLAKNAGQVSTPDGAKMLTSSQQFITSLRNVLLAAVRSSNFRRIIVDLLRIAKDVFGDLDTTHIHNSFINSGEMTQVSTRDATKQTLMAHASNVRQGNVDISQENANQIRADLRELLTELNGHPEGREALRQLLGMWEMINTEFYNNADLAHGDPDIARTYAEAKVLVEAYTGGRTVDIFLMRLRSVVAIAERDAELHLYMQEVRNHLRACLDNPALIESDEYFRQADRLLERGRTFANQYRGEPAVQNLMYEAQVLGDSMRSDPHILLIGEKAANLASHVTYTDKQGNTKLDSDLLPLVRNELIPFMINRIKEVPIKGFQISNEDFEYLIVDDLFLTIDDILPDHVRVRTENDTHVAVQAVGGSASRSFIDIQIDGVRVSLKDFYFSFKRRKLIKMIDEGRADLKILGDGVYIRIRYEITNSPTGGLMLSHAHVEARVSKIDFNVLSAKHKGRLNLIAGLFKSRIQTQVSNSLQNKIAEKSVELAEILNSKVLNNMSRERLATLAKTGGAAISGASLVN